MASQFRASAEKNEWEVSPARLRRAKIVCTLGPATSSEAMIRELIRAGMDVARLNFSHGTHQEHARLIGRLRRLARSEGRNICILQDLQGPKIRTGELKSHLAVELKSGSTRGIRGLEVAEAMVHFAEQELARRGIIHPGDVLALLSGTQKRSGATNLMYLQQIPDKGARPTRRSRIRRGNAPPKAVRRQKERG